MVCNITRKLYIVTKWVYWLLILVFKCLCLTTFYGHVLFPYRKKPTKGVTGTPHRPQNGIDRRLNSPQSNDESAGLKRSTRTSRDKSSRSRFIFPCIWLSGRITRFGAKEPNRSDEWEKIVLSNFFYFLFQLDPSFDHWTIRETTGVWDEATRLLNVWFLPKSKSHSQGKVAGSKNEMSQTDKRLYKPRIAKMFLYSSQLGPYDSTCVTIEAVSATIQVP